MLILTSTALQFLAFPAGVIRGALANLGISSTVSGESLGLPQSTYRLASAEVHCSSGADLYPSA